MEAKFSLTSIALGNLRRRRGRYLLLIPGIVLAIYFVATALLFADTMFVSLRERHYNRQGGAGCHRLRLRGGASRRAYLKGHLFGIRDGRYFGLRPSRRTGAGERLLHRPFR